MFFPGRAKPKILVLGLDNSGKTTLLVILNRTSPLLATSLGPLATIPTLSPSTTEFLIGDTICDGYDIGGYLPNRTCWAQYTYDVSGVIFCVDASDPDKFDTAKFELDKLLVNENLDGIPILVFGTKVDAPKSVNEERLMQALDIGYTLKKVKLLILFNRGQL
ncbi:hypothetical protein INT47_011245 [Mucor saturninus]|uniref:Uncharacterized protein n=1 Tax=Mucor saturninus TaxID=64648 RepID=A0A8H7V7K6_9FUNG|nr:hypothetical protein INT47_011245 [Mucor saturninus]